MKEAFRQRRGDIKFKPRIDGGDLFGSRASARL